jgi:3-dehydroquinate dehydratase-2
LGGELAKNRVLVIHGPNLNLLGRREKGIYGDVTLKEIDSNLKKLAKELGLEVSTFQSNSEGEIVGAIQGSLGKMDGILINPAAYTHTSVAIRDALLAVGTPVIEAHLSNIHKREEFRHRSFVSDIAIGSIIGFGPESYYLGLRAFKNLLK